MITHYKYDENFITKNRAYISKELKNLSNNIKSDTIKRISPADIRLLFDLYDSVFFNNYFREEYKGTFKFSLSRRMTKSAGLTLCPKNIGSIKPEEVVIEFRIGIDLFFQYEILDRLKVVCGYETNNALESIQLVLEHEICHAIEFIFFHKSSCKGNRFKTIAKNIFGHTSSYHQLPTNRELAREKYGLNLGNKVDFNFKGKNISGIIYGINKRATIMVKDKKGQYTDKQGNRYAKYYIPLNELKKK